MVLLGSGPFAGMRTKSPPGALSNFVQAVSWSVPNSYSLTKVILGMLEHVCPGFSLNQETDHGRGRGRVSSS